MKKTLTEKLQKGLYPFRIVENSLIIDRNNSKEVSVLDLKEKTSTQGRKAIVATCQSYPKNRLDIPQKYKCSIIGLENSGPLYKQRCMYSCTCDRFMYYFEVALSKKGAAKVKYSNGEMPVNTNPHMIAGGCKHLIRTLKFIIRKKL